jgi:hypothetical protein
MLYHLFIGKERKKEKGETARWLFPPRADTPY